MKIRFRWPWVRLPNEDDFRIAMMMGDIADLRGKLVAITESLEDQRLLKRKYAGMGTSVHPIKLDAIADRLYALGLVGADEVPCKWSLLGEPVPVKDRLPESLKNAHAKLNALAKHLGVELVNVASTAEHIEALPIVVSTDASTKQGEA